MTQRFVALVRAINVGGTGLISMESLRGLLEATGCEGVSSILQSGNLIFRFEGTNSQDLEEKFERAAQEHLGLKTSFIVRTETDWSQIVEANPYPDAAREIPGYLLVMCLKTAPEETRIEPLRQAIKGGEYFQAIGRQLYIVYPNGSGQSRFTGAVIEKKLGTPGTTRNWNTVLKIATALRR